MRSNVNQTKCVVFMERGSSARRAPPVLANRNCGVAYAPTCGAPQVGLRRFKRRDLCTRMSTSGADAICGVPRRREVEAPARVISHSGSDGCKDTGWSCAMLIRSMWECTVSSSVHTCCTPGIWGSFGEQLVETGDALAQKQNSCRTSIKMCGPAELPRLSGGARRPRSVPVADRGPRRTTTSPPALWKAASTGYRWSLSARGCSGM